MAFELETLTKAKLLDVVVLSQKNRMPDENPGAKLIMELSLSNHVLAQFDGYLKAFLFTKNGGESPKSKQGTLDGVEPVSDMPNLSGIGAHIGALRWSSKMTGYTLTIDQGLGTRASNIEIEGCTLDGWRIRPAEGGSVTVKINIESPDVSESVFGKLAKLKCCEIKILLTPPGVAQEDIEHDRLSLKNGVVIARKSATDEFVGQHAPH